MVKKIGKYYLPINSCSIKPACFTTESKAFMVANTGCNFAKGHIFGPSESALAGSGWVSIKIPATPVAIAARAKGATNSR